MCTYTQNMLRCNNILRTSLILEIFWENIGGQQGGGCWGEGGIKGLKSNVKK